jgi:hypothetical protein
MSMRNDPLSAGHPSKEKGNQCKQVKKKLRHTGMYHTNKKSTELWWQQGAGDGGDRDNAREEARMARDGERGGGKTATADTRGGIVEGG